MASVFRGFRTKLHTGVGAKPSRREALVQAQRAWDRGEFAKALEGFQQALRARPADARVRLKVAQLHEKLGARDRAIEAYTKAAEQFVADAHDKQAASLLRQVLALDPANREARLRLADLYARLERRCDALVEYRAILVECREASDADATLATLARIADLDPEDTRIHCELARLRCERGQEEAARGEYAALLHKLEEQRDWESVVKTAEAALENLPDFLEALQVLARAKLALDEPEGLIRMLELSLPDFADEIELRGLLAQAYETLGDADAAARVYRAIADVYRQRGDDEHAREVLQRHVCVEPLAGEDESKVRESMAQAGPPIEEETSFVTLSDIDCTHVDEQENPGDSTGSDTSHCFAPPAEKVEDAQSHRDLAVAYIEMDAYERALDELEQLRRFPHAEVEALSLMATCKAAMGSPAVAACYLENAILCAGDQVYAAVPLRYELGQVLLAADQHELALDVFREVATLGPGYRNVEQQIAALEHGGRRQ